MRKCDQRALVFEAAEIMSTNLSPHDDAKHSHSRTCVRGCEQGDRNYRWIELSLRSVSNVLALSNLAEGTSQSVKRSSGTRDLIFVFCRSLDRSIARSIAQSLARSLDRSIARSIARSLDCSIARSLDRSLPQSPARMGVQGRLGSR